MPVAKKVHDSFFKAFVFLWHTVLFLLSLPTPHRIASLYEKLQITETIKVSQECAHVLKGIFIKEKQHHDLVTSDRIMNEQQS